MGRTIFAAKTTFMIDGNNKIDIEIWTINHLLERYPWSKSTIYRWIRERKIPHMKIGRRILFSKQEIENWLKDFTVSTVQEEQYCKDYRNENDN